ncbi:hypothetical protein GCM10027093_60680 [Paraburkholderia jirisanensis]
MSEKGRTEPVVVRLSAINRERWTIAPDLATVRLLPRLTMAFDSWVGFSRRRHPEFPLPPVETVKLLDGGFGVARQTSKSSKAVGVRVGSAGPDSRSGATTIAKWR